MMMMGTSGVLTGYHHISVDNGNISMRIVMMVIVMMVIVAMVVG